MDYDYLLKHIIIREYGVGKSSFLWGLKGKRVWRRSVPDLRSDCSFFHLHHLNVEGRPFKFRIGNFLRCNLAWSFIRRETFNLIPSLVEEARQFSKPNITIMLVGNKCDLEKERAVSKEEGEQFAEQNGLLFVEASVATTQNVEE